MSVVTALSVHVVIGLTVHILKSKPHTIEVFRSFAEVHTLVMLKTRQNAYGAAFKLYISVAYKPVWLICENTFLFFNLVGVANIQVHSLAEIYKMLFYFSMCLIRLHYIIII